MTAVSTIVYRPATLATLIITGSAYFAAHPVQAQEAREFKDVVYATVDGKPLALDMYLAAGKKTTGRIVWIHGGAWYLYDKKQYPKPLVDAGFALASLDFRQSTEARFPAQAYD
ncbi:MAG TPA: hypothetical protein VET48_14475, partial [Steroidobacteraceae bacterium]|nr:hypothetical protein [Steroidobacteraceae bacterium]